MDSGTATIVADSLVTSVNQASDTLQSTEAVGKDGTEHIAPSYLLAKLWLWKPQFVKYTGSKNVVIGNTYSKRNRENYLRGWKIQWQKKEKSQLREKPREM